MKRRAVVFISCWCFAIGVAIASFLPEKLKIFHFEFFIVLSGFLILVFIFRSKKFFIAFLWGGFLVLGFWRFFISIPQTTPDKIWFYNGETAVFWGVVVDEPEKSAKNRKLKIKSFYLQSKEIKTRGNVLVYSWLYPEYEYGDILKIKCDLRQPEKFEDFSYDKYLAAQGIYSVCFFPRVEKVKREDLPDKEFFSFTAVFPPAWFYKNISALKKKMGEIIASGLHEPEAGAAMAMVLGDKSGLTKSLRNNFSASGLSHVLAISGLHIGIIVAIIFNFILLAGAERKTAFYLTTAFLIFYIILVGAPSSAVRAGVMGFLVLLAFHTGRLNRLDYALALVGAVLLFINPKQLAGDVGFQLSFLAVLGIAWFYPLFSRRFFLFFKKRENKILKIMSDSFNITFSAQIFTLPIIIHNFKIISLISPLSNLLVLWLLPFILIAIFAGLFLSFFAPPFSFLFFAPSFFMLKAVVFISETLIKIPFAYFILK